jgi:hypothetical protein
MLVILSDVNRLVILSDTNRLVILSDPERSEGESKDLRLLFVALKGRNRQAGFFACGKTRSGGRPAEGGGGFNPRIIGTPEK